MERETLDVVARLVARPEEEGKVRQELVKLIAPTRAEAGCLKYELLVNKQDPAEFVFVEEYRADSDFDSHLASPHLAADHVTSLWCLSRGLSS